MYGGYQRAVAEDDDVGLARWRLAITLLREPVLPAVLLIFVFHVVGWALHQITGQDPFAPFVQLRLVANDAIAVLIGIRWMWQRASP